MAQEYICMDSKNDQGLIALNSSVFESIAVYSCEDIKGISLPKDKKSAKAVTCKVVNNVLTITINVNMKTGYNLQKQCEALQMTTARSIDTMTGIKNCVINVNVIGYEE